MRTPSVQTADGWQHYCVDCDAPAGDYYKKFDPPCDSARCWKCQDKHIQGSMQRVTKSFWD